MNKINKRLIIAIVIMVALTITTIAGGYAAGIISPSKSDKSSEETSWLGSIVNASDGKETTSADEITEGDIKAFMNWVEEQPDVDAPAVTKLLEEYFKKYNYIKGNDGSYLVPLSDESLMDTDAQRPFWGQQAGLVNYQIDDAMARPFNLTEDQKNKILSLAVNDTANMTDAELEGFRDQLLKTFLEDPILFEAYVRLLSDQHIGQTERFGDHWFAGQRFIETYDQARFLGKGLNVWLRKINGTHYTNSEYHKYVSAVVLMLTSRETEVVRLVAGPNDHYSLWAGDFSSLRMASPANYYEDLPSLSFIFKLKNGKIALRLGANLIDKRPEVLNYTTMKKEVAVSSTPSAPSKSKKSSGGGSDTPTPTPFNPPTPGPTPGPTPPGGEIKNPNEDAANAITDWPDDDPGSGEHRADTGNSKSQTVEGSGGHAYTVVNHDGADPSNYNQGPAADSTDNGAVPDTSAPENQVGIGDGVNHDSVNGGQSTTSTTNSGRISAPPV